MTAPSSPWATRLVTASVLVYALHRLLVLLGSGDLIAPLEPSELKHTQVAWDWMSGRLGSSPEFRLRSYIISTSQVHHGSYSSALLAYQLSRALFGFGLVSVKAVPWAAWVATVALWSHLLR